jgi:hypothetical protein
MTGRAEKFGCELMGVLVVLSGQTRSVTRLPWVP